MTDPIRRVRAIDFARAREVSDVLAPMIERVVSGAVAERELDRLLRAHRDWDATLRQTSAELLFGVSLWRRRLSPEPRTGREWIGLFLRDLAGWAESDALAATGADRLPAPHLAVSPAERYSVPDWLSDHLERELGSDLEPLLAALNVPGPITLRANLLLGSRDELREQLAREGIATDPGRWSPTALIARARFNVLGSAAHRQGRFEIMDEGSQLIGHLVEATPGTTVLDLCAGAGGKTLLLAAAMQNQGTLVAHDINLLRLDRLVTRAERARARVQVLRALPESLEAEAVLVDAPCSELGALRRGPDLRFRFGPESLDQMSPVQADVLARAARFVRRGGRLIYATCTWNHAENEDRVRRFLEEQPGFTLSRLPEWALPFSDGPFFKSFPHRHGTDGFFAAVMRRQ